MELINILSCSCEITKGIKMNNSEEKKQSIMSRMKKAFAEGGRGEYEKVLERSERVAKKLCNELNSMGLRANILLDYGWPQATKVEIADSPIRWVNVTLVDDFDQDRAYSVVVIHNFIIPDSKHLPELEIRAVPRRRHGLILGGSGKLIDIRWKGNDCGTGVSRDQEIKDSIMSLINEKGKPMEDDTLTTFLKIYTRPETSCWVISTEHINIFNQDQWRRYESIAKCLLKATIPS